jgi:hypothetical protein
VCTYVPDSYAQRTHQFLMRMLMRRDQFLTRMLSARISSLRACWGYTKLTF